MKSECLEGAAGAVLRSEGGTGCVVTTVTLLKLPTSAHQWRAMLRLSELTQL